MISPGINQNYRVEYYIITRTELPNKSQIRDWMTEEDIIIGTAYLMESKVIYHFFLFSQANAYDLISNLLWIDYFF